ncbi:aldehyde reductase 2 [Aspergillus lentulus]|uniref:aldehyde reductase II n=1 Tax=Aspergillus lentulus TaxID=293939 RepID=UPI001394CC30|nr:aldehyde reductase 2 [Aspergillus lentulus]GFF55073.1 aldehyde reductase 2 [Aspergillus lentulus]
MGSTAPTTVPSGGLVLVTGVNGFLASQLALNLGYKLRGTVQFQDKADWITEAVTKRYPDASFKTVVVPNISVPGAFDDAIRGVDGIAHVASDLSFGSDPEKVITPMLEALRSFLRSATKEPSVKRFVLTSSAIAALTPQPEKEMHVDANTWNDSGIERRGVRRRTTPSGARTKTSPSLSPTPSLPDFIVGPIIHAKQNGSTGRWVKEFFDDPVNYYKPLQTIIPRHFNERLLAFAGPFNFNNWLSVFRKIDPAKPWPEDDPNQAHDRSTVDTRRSKELLKRYSRPDFTSFVESVRDNCLNSDPEWKRSNFP